MIATGHTRARVRRGRKLGEREIEFVASTAQVASDGKVIRTDAWQSSIDRIRAGGRIPKVFAGHQAAYPDGRQPAIGLIPPESIRIEPGVGLVHRIRFATEDVHPEGPRYYAAYRDNFLDQVSVGWDREVLAPESEWADRATPEVSDLEWLETSCVGLGADYGAVKRALALAGRREVQVAHARALALASGGALPRNLTATERAAVSRAQLAVTERSLESLSRTIEAARRNDAERVSMLLGDLTAPARPADPVARLMGDLRELRALVGALR